MLDKHLKYFIFNEKEANKKLGNIFAKSIQKEIAKIDLLPNSFYVAKEKLLKTYPKYYQEIIDRAEGANVDADKYLFLISHELKEKYFDRCSDIIVKKDNKHILLGHNEDGTYDINNSALVKYKTNNGWYIEYATYDALAGTTFIYNNYHLLYTVNYVYVENSKIDEISSWFLLRSIVNCKNINQILLKLSQVKCASGFNINVVDLKSGKAFSIELMYNRIFYKEIHTVFIHTNHYLHNKKRKFLNHIYK